jgi:hypothetical protein
MKKLILLLFPLLLMQQSCVIVIKGLARSVTDNYDDQANKNLSAIQLESVSGNSGSFAERFAGKTVYAMVYNSPLQEPPSTGMADYAALKERFQPYDDVVFIQVYTGSSSQYWTGFSGKKAGSSEFYRLKSFSVLHWSDLGDSPQALIIGKDGQVLGYKGPKPNDKILVDYVLCEARNGVNASTSAKALIRDVNRYEHFKSEEMRRWYSGHFKKSPKDMSFSISGDN